MPMNSVYQELDRTPWGQLVLDPLRLGGSPGRPAADGWNHLKTPSLTCLRVGAGCELGASVPLHLGISNTLQTFSEHGDQGSKGRHAQRENAWWKLIHLWWPSLASLTALFLPQSIHQKQVTKASPYARGGESDTTSCWEECQSPGEKKMGLEILLWSFMENKIFIYIYHI